MSNRREYHKQYCLENKERCSGHQKRYYKNNTEEILKRHQQWREDNPEYDKLYYLDNKERKKEYNKQYHKNNHERIMENTKQWQKNKCRTDLKYNLNKRMSNKIRLSLCGSKMGRHWETLVGYTLDDLTKHLKSTIPQGYRWEDIFGGRLHIDHIIPKSVFNFTKPEHIDFKRCWTLSNLQLLPAEENCSKSNKLTKSFQPTLAI